MLSCSSEALVELGLELDSKEAAHKQSLQSIHWYLNHFVTRRQKAFANFKFFTGFVANQTADGIRGGTHCFGSDTVSALVISQAHFCWLQMLVRAH